MDKERETAARATAQGSLLAERPHQSFLNPWERRGQPRPVAAHKRQSPKRSGTAQAPAEVHISPTLWEQPLP